MDKIELTAEELSQLTKRAAMIGDKKMETAIMEREAVYKIMEIVASRKLDASAAWAWQKNFLVRIDASTPPIPEGENG